MELSHEVIALACILVKTCPPHLTIREYCALVAKHGVKGSRPVTKKQPHGHIDATDYYKSLSKQKQRENDELRNKLGRYEAPASPHWDQFVRTVYGASQTPGIIEDIRYDGRQGEEDANDVPSILLTLLWELGQVIASRHTDAQRFSQNVNYYVDRILARMTEHVTDASNEALTAYRAIVTTTGGQTRFSRALLDAIHDDQQKLRDLTDASIKAIRVANTVIPSLIKMIARLDIDEGQVIYQIVHSLGAFADLMLAVAEASRSNTNGSSQSGKELRNSTKAIGEDLLNLLSTVLRSLEPEAIPHQAVFEGMLYQLFRRLGPIMHEINFGVVDQPDTRRVIADMPILPNGQTELEVQTVSHAKLVWLMPLVKEALQRAPAFMGDSRLSSQSQRPSRIVKSRFSDRSRSKLQATLLKTIFQDDNAHLGYLDSLQSPQPGAKTHVRPARVKVSTVKDWLNEQMWKLVGWDLLTGRDERVKNVEKVVQGRGIVSSSNAGNT